MNFDDVSDFTLFDTLLIWEAKLKREMNTLKKETGMKLGHCYEAAAKAKGYGSYAAMRTAAKIHFLSKE